MTDPLGAFVSRLKVMPASDPRARAAILARVRGRRQSAWRATLTWAWQPSVPLLAAATIVVVALGAGYAGRVLVEPPASTARGVDAGADAVGTTALTPVRNDESSRLVAQQFLFEARGANRVAIVGDFNGWDGRAATSALTSPARNGVWEITLLLPPGRHSYAFLVNDTLLVADPRMPKEPVDPDFGTPRSAILVNDR